MKPEDWARVSALFQEALGLAPGEWGAFLDRSASGLEVRAEVERLLRLDRAAGETFEPARVLLSAAWAPGPGARIGNFTIRRVLASGGMGTVYEAVQDRPQRVVALKTLHLGLPTPERLQRFLLEVEVLGRLQHPGIAQVYETGMHRVGDVALPYFAMELVEGARDILTHAHESRLGPRERLALFVRVCAAVQHGHQRGVVHRDLKPANLLVDSAGLPKVIDFGVARITGEERVALEKLTLPGQIVGTLRYMSPEQVSGRASEVDTRSDVYALGCILHELLSGRPPYDLEGLSLASAARVLTESEPTRPRELPADLGWIVVRCLAREPDRRYGTASELADDIERYLRHEPVMAGAPSRGYRLQKYLRRNRLWLTAVAAVVASLALGLVRARSEARVARLEAEKARVISAFLERTLTSAGHLERGPETRVVDLLQEVMPQIEIELAGQPGARAVIEYVAGKSFLELWRVSEAEEHLAAAARFTEANLSAGDPLRIAVSAGQARLLLVRERPEEAAALSRATEALALAHLGPDHETTLQVQGTLAEALVWARHPAEAERCYDELIPRLVARRGPEDHEVIGARGGRAIAWEQQGRLAEAREEFEQLLALAERVLPPGHFRICNAKGNLAWNLLEQGEAQRAEELVTDILVLAEDTVGPDHPLTWPAYRILVEAMERQGRPAEAEPLLQRVLDLMRAEKGDADGEVQVLRVRLARLQLVLGERDSAEGLLRSVLTRVAPDSAIAVEARELLERL